MLLITGATGFLGSELISALLKQNLKFKALTRNPEDALILGKKGLQTSLGDITDRKAVENAAKGCDSIIHAAAVIRGTKEEYEKVNVEGTRNILEAARKEKATHIIFLSTILAAYEKTTDYGKSKLEGENLIKESGIPYTILRLSLAYKDNDDKTIGKIIKAVKLLPVIPLMGNGQNILQPVHAKDVAAATAIAANKKPENKTYYLAGPQITFRNMVKAIAAELKLKRTLMPVPKPVVKAAVAILAAATLHKLFTSDQLEFILAGKTFSYEEAAKDLKFNPIQFGEGIRRIHA